MKPTLLLLLLAVVLLLPSCKRSCYTCNVYDRNSAATAPTFQAARCDMTKGDARRYERQNTDAQYEMRCFENK